MTTIESGNLPDRRFFISIQKGWPFLYAYKNGSSFREGKVLGVSESCVHGFIRIFKLKGRNVILSVRRWDC